MTLCRLGYSVNLLTALSRTSHTASTPIGEMRCTRYAAAHQNRTKNLHVTSARRYPDPPTLMLPTNVAEIFANETGRFTPERTRDIAAPVLLHAKSDSRFSSDEFGRPMGRSGSSTNSSDARVDSYDCFGAVSLNSTMQSNVPKPFCSSGKSMHLNMPGGQWARDGKYIAEDMQKSHYRSTRLPPLNLDKSGLANCVAIYRTLRTISKPKYTFVMEYSTKVSPSLNNSQNIEDKNPAEVETMNLTKKAKLKKIVKDYGYTVLAFHVTISLISLGACYTAVANGIDLMPVVQNMFNVENEQLQSIVKGSSTFVVAYTFHKFMAPIRLTITLGVVPFLVRKLRKYGILKPLNNDILNTK